MRVEWQAKAREDALAIADYVAIDNPSAAIAVLEEIHQQIVALTDHPHMGRQGRVRGTRELVINRTPYISAYRIDGEVVSILCVTHGARKWPGKF